MERRLRGGKVIMPFRHGNWTFLHYEVLGESSIDTRLDIIS